MKAIFLILFVFATFIMLLGLSAKTTENNALGNALLFGAVSIYFGLSTTWLLFTIKERGGPK